MATEQKTDYDYATYPNPCRGGVCKVMMICTGEQHLTMRNGRRFSTGNHPVEMLVPMLHLEQAGFTTDIFTPTGRPAQIEMWAMPGKDEAVQGIYRRYQPQFEQLGSF